RLHRWMHRRPAACSCVSRRGAGVAPHIAALFAGSRQLRVFRMRLAAGLKHTDELVLAAVERPPSALVLCPDTQVDKLGLDLSTSRKQLTQMSPIGAHVEQTADHTECGLFAKTPGKKNGVRRGACFPLIAIDRC